MYQSILIIKAQRYGWNSYRTEYYRVKVQCVDSAVCGQLLLKYDNLMIQLISTVPLTAHNRIEVCFVGLFNKNMK